MRKWRLQRAQRCGGQALLARLGLSDHSFGLSVKLLAHAMQRSGICCSCLEKLLTETSSLEHVLDSEQALGMDDGP